MHHAVMKGDILALEGFETRVVDTRDASDNNRMRSAPFRGGSRRLQRA